MVSLVYSWHLKTWKCLTSTMSCSISLFSSDPVGRMPQVHVIRDNGEFCKPAHPFEQETYLPPNQPTDTSACSLQTLQKYALLPCSCGSFTFRLHSLSLSVIDRLPTPSKTPPTLLNKHAFITDLRNLCISVMWQAPQSCRDLKRHRC